MEEDFVRLNQCIHVLLPESGKVLLNGFGTPGVIIIGSSKSPGVRNIPIRFLFE